MNFVGNPASLIWKRQKPDNICIFTLIMSFERASICLRWKRRMRVYSITCMYMCLRFFYASNGQIHQEMYKKYFYFWRVAIFFPTIETSPRGYWRVAKSRKMNYWRIQKNMSVSSLHNTNKTGPWTSTEQYGALIVLVLFCSVLVTTYYIVLVVWIF